MGFTTGIVSGMEMGVPHYYIDDDGGNQWDANTYCTIIFDGSGSMGQVITALESAMGGEYFSSGSAANGNGVKNHYSIRSTVQDYYATAGIEGAPDYNTDIATNGVKEFEKHVQMQTLSESSAYYFSTPYKAGTTGTWPSNAVVGDFSHADFITPSNFIQIVVCNESQTEYHDSLDGAGWADSEITTDWKDDISRLRNAVGESGLDANGYSDVSQPTSIEDRADGHKPSLTMVLIDPGYQDSKHNGPDVGFGFYSTGSQVLWGQGALGGLGSYALGGVTSGHNYSISDFQALTAWNLRNNAFVIDHLNQQHTNSSVSFWKARLIAALQQNINV